MPEGLKRNPQANSTLSVVEKLFKELHDSREHIDEPPPGCTPSKDSYQAWKTYIKSVRDASDVGYRDDGNPVVFATETRETDVDVALYRWGLPEWYWPRDNFPDTAKHVAPPPQCCKIICDSQTWTPINWEKVRGVMFFVHGITENARFCILNCKPLLNRDRYAWDGQSWGARQDEDMLRYIKTQPIDYTTEESFLSHFLSEGFVVYAPDLPGHGLSGAWGGSRCNTRNTEDIVDSIVDMINTLVNMNEIPEYFPIVLAGLSLGGCIAARSLQEGFKRGVFRISPIPSYVTDRADDRDAMDQAALNEKHKKDIVSLEPKQASIRVACLFCPALGTENLKKKFPNNVFYPIKDPIARHFPKLRLVSLASSDRFRWIPNWIQRDPLVYTKKLPLRISGTTTDAIERIQPEIRQLPPELPILIIHSKLDTMTDPQGSKAFLESFPGRDKEVKFLDYGWHFLTKEPGYMKTIHLASEWILQRF